jgi:hypothetical protein
MKLFAAIILSLAIAGSAPAGDESSGAVNCTFQAAPDAYLSRDIKVRQEIFDRVAKWQKSMTAPRSAAAADTGATDSPVPHRSFIDDEIFNRLDSEKVPPAKLSTDEEFFRRISLDLTGRLPASDAIRAFVADTSATKRDDVIDKLLNSPEFNDKWTMWLGDLVQNSTTAVTTNFPRQIAGRNKFQGYLYWSIAGWKSLRDIALETTWATGNNYDTGEANFIIGGSVTGGPAQDTYDGMLVRSASVWLGLGSYDCVLCHDGRRHLDAINLWGSQVTRMDAERVAAFFARTRLSRYPAPAPPAGQTSTDPHFNSTNVEDTRGTNGYDLNTNYGNRPNRVASGATRSLTPVYRVDGSKPSDGGWRSAFAGFMVNDPMFSRNLANRLWKQMFNLGLVDPVDTLDPARLDPNNPPPDPWTLQATHPVLLEKLARNLADSNYDLRGYLRMLAQSSAYQLSSRYEGAWSVASVPLFARHYPRRLDGEEVHDAIAQATGVLGKYTVEGWANPFQWAMQLPEPTEPRSNTAVANFMNSFLRGNRDTTKRSQANSILQQLNLMNDNFVYSRTRLAASPVLMSLSKVSDNNAMLDEMFLTFLSRKPTAWERSHSLTYLVNATTPAARNTVIEDLAWACINKIDFLFSY